MQRPEENIQLQEAQVDLMGWHSRLWAVEPRFIQGHLGKAFWSVVQQWPSTADVSLQRHSPTAFVNHEVDALT